MLFKCQNQVFRKHLFKWHEWSADTNCQSCSYIQSHWESTPSAGTITAVSSLCCILTRAKKDHARTSSLLIVHKPTVWVKHLVRCQSIFLSRVGSHAKQLQWAILPWIRLMFEWLQRAAVSKSRILTRCILRLWFEVLQTHPTTAQWQIKCPAHPEIIQQTQ